MGLRGRLRPAEVEGWSRLHDVPALRLWGGSSLPHACGVQPPPETAPAGGAPQQAVQVVGTHVPVSNGFGHGSWLASDSVLICVALSWVLTLKIITFPTDLVTKAVSLKIEMFQT